ncbi:MAG: Maf family protein [Planctomycetota bacterium]|jgi:septum formation protein
MIQHSLSFILASASPRRRELLTRAGYDFEVVVADVDESSFSTDGLTAEEYAEWLALAKAKFVGEKSPDSLVLGADTVADFGGEIIGKPADAKHAEEITRKLFSEPHRVVTGVAIVRLSDGFELVRSDSTTVYPKPLTPEQIAEHIDNGSWRDKAGAYAIKEDGDEFVERIEGSLTNVMGLPMELLEQMFAQLPCG